MKNTEKVFTPEQLPVAVRAAVLAGGDPVFGPDFWSEYDERERLGDEYERRQKMVEPRRTEVPTAQQE